MGILDGQTTSTASNLTATNTNTWVGYDKCDSGSDPSPLT